MSGNRTRADFLSFLDYLGQKGLIPSATAASRKATANKVLAILEGDEASDVLSLDLENIMKRFQNLHSQQYTPDSLQTYKSRMKTALEDFRTYHENPLSFKPAGQGKSKSKPIGEKLPSLKRNGHAAIPAEYESSRPGVNVIPIPLRSDLTVQIAGIPFDLTKAEAQKIANIVIAHAVVE